MRADRSTSRTLAHYQKLAPAMGERAYGFKILYGPPIINAPALFVEQQPAGNHQSGVDGKAAGERIGWPNRTEYAFHSWKLASKMRRVWSVNLLDRCTGVNANFFRAPSDEEWGKLPAPLRSVLFTQGRSTCAGVATSMRRCDWLGGIRYAESITWDRSATRQEANSRQARHPLGLSSIRNNPSERRSCVKQRVRIDENILRRANLMLTHSPNQFRPELPKRVTHLRGYPNVLARGVPPSILPRNENAAAHPRDATHPCHMTGRLIIAAKSLRPKPIPSRYPDEPPCANLKDCWRFRCKST